MDAQHGQAEPEFRPDEYFEVLLRIRRDQPRRYAREVSAGVNRRLELYEQRKAQDAAAPARRAKAA